MRVCEQRSCSRSDENKALKSASDQPSNNTLGTNAHTDSLLRLTLQAQAYTYKSPSNQPTNNTIGTDTHKQTQGC